jgi:uncharacterized SAM-binding protein YcdF (DUF218 family)
MTGEHDALLTSPVLAAARTLWAYHCIYGKLAKADAILGLGSYDLRVADRCAALYTEGYAAKVIFTGLAGNWTRGLYPRSEAATFGDRAQKMGVPASAIWLEETATNIGENLRYSAPLLDGAQHVIIVTKPQTQRRCLATAAAQWPEVKVTITAPTHGFDAQPIPSFSLDHLIHEMVGDLARMEAYARAGYQTAQMIPGTISQAFDLLVAHGYTRHMPE